MRCGACAAENRETARFCTTCGASLVTSDPPPVVPRYCTQCGAALRPGAHFCTTCGARMANAPAPADRQITPPAMAAPPPAGERAPAAQSTPVAQASGAPPVEPARAPLPSPVPAEPRANGVAAHAAAVPAAIGGEENIRPRGGFGEIWRAIMREPTGIAPAVVIFGVGAALSWAFWRPLSLPARNVAALIPVPQCASLPSAAIQRCATQVGFLSYAGPVVLMVFMAALGFALHFLINVVLPRLPDRLRPPPSVGLLLPPLVATLLFAMGWSGLYFGQPGPPGFLPQPVFPALAGFFAFATIRWGPRVQGALDWLFAQRDRIHLLIRLGLASLVPFLFTQWANVAKNGPPAGRLEQLTVVVGFAAGYLFLAPRRPPVTALDAALLAELGIADERTKARRA